jgi:hypothetical protein
MKKSLFFISLCWQADFLVVFRAQARRQSQVLLSVLCQSSIFRAVSRAGRLAPDLGRALDFWSRRLRSCLSRFFGLVYTAAAQTRFLVRSLRFGSRTSGSASCRCPRVFSRQGFVFVAGLLFPAVRSVLFSGLRAGSRSGFLSDFDAEAFGLPARSVALGLSLPLMLRFLFVFRVRHQEQFPSGRCLQIWFLPLRFPS